MSRHLIYHNADEVDTEQESDEPEQAYSRLLFHHQPRASEQWADLFRWTESTDYGHTDWFVTGGEIKLHDLPFANITLGGFLDVAIAGSTSELEAEISRATETLKSLGDDWDGEGGTPFDLKTIQRATGLARSIYMKAAATGARLFVPTIGPAASGSIDIYWSTSALSLLVNVPADMTRCATYSGQSGENTIHGKLSPETDQVDHLVAWLAG